MATYVQKINEYIKSKGIEKIDPFPIGNDYLVRDDMVDGVSSPYIKEWNLEIPKPSDDEINTFESAANTQGALDEVRGLRGVDYYNELGTWRDQLDMIYHDIDDWKAKVKAIKDKRPKP